ncbi:MAG TPA: 4Fe-4S binding protein [Propionibacteriaceae bacterium]|nr:4Fe-4S binding protein [Propionibacteriaceae bacterium]
MSEPLATSTLHGSIRLIPSACTSCMICARECPTWCIHIDSHTEALTDLPPGTRERSRNVLDRFEIDWSLCMYCGICVEQCPFDALEWAGAHVAPAGELGDLVHGVERLSRPRESE